MNADNSSSVIKLLNVALDTAEKSNTARGGSIFHNDVGRVFARGARLKVETITAKVSEADANLHAVINVQRAKPQPFFFTVDLKIKAVGEGDLLQAPYKIIGLRITKPVFINGEDRAEMWAAGVLADMRAVA